MNTFTLFDTHNISVLKDIVLDDDSRERAGQMYLILRDRKNDILANTNIFTIKDLWYSEYYWHFIAMKEFNAENAVDWQDEQFHIIKYMDCEIEIDCDILESIENGTCRFRKTF